MTLPRKAMRPALVAAALGLAGWAGAAIAQPAGLPPEAIAKAEGPTAYPTFGSVPALPKDVRTAAQWKADVVGIRMAGAHMQRLASNLPPAADDTDAWAAQARAEATPPPSVTTHDADTDALVAALRARASAPSRPR